MSKLVASCTGFAVAPAQMLELDESGPKVFLSISDEPGGQIMAFMILVPAEARRMAAEIASAARAAEEGGGRLLPPAIRGGRA